VHNIYYLLRKLKNHQAQCRGFLNAVLSLFYMDIIIPGP